MPATRCERCRDSELAEIADFAAGVFGVDFPNYLPRLYRPGAATGHDHFAVRKNGALAAAVINFPLTLTVAQTELLTYGVGTVSVSEASRGKGYMTDLLTECVAEAAERGAAFSILSGQRQRYEHFGYALIGTHTVFEITPSSLRHALDAKTEPYTLREASACDGSALARMMEGRPVYAERAAEEFTVAAAADYHRTFIVSDGTADVGYVVAKGGLGSVSEAVLLPGASIDALLLGILRSQGGSFSISAPAHETELFARLGKVCDRWHSAPYANVCVLDFPAVISAFAELLLRTRSVSDGRFVLGVEAHPFIAQIGAAKEGRTHGNFGISVTDGRLDVRSVDSAADIELAYLDALELLFGRTGEGMAYLPPLARELFALPFYFPKADMV